jgi:BA14K-like protein
MRKSAVAITAAILASWGALPCSAQNLAAGPVTAGAFVRSDLTPIAWYYDGRDDIRDFPTNGFFPGDFAADPASAAIGAAGIFGSAPYRSYPSQLIDGSQPDQSYCARRFRSYDPASGTFIGYDGLRHRCQ